MMKQQQVEEPDGTRHVVAPIIISKIATSAKCAGNVCESCLLGRSKKQSLGLSKFKSVPAKEGIIDRDKYEVGDFVSADQFVLHTPGILPSRYGRERRQNRFHSSTIFNDAVSGLIWVEN